MVLIGLTTKSRFWSSKHSHSRSAHWSSKELPNSFEFIIEFYVIAPCDTCVWRITHRNMYLPYFLCRNDLCINASVWWEHVQSACFYLCVYRFSFRPILTVWAFCCFSIILQTAGQGRRLEVIDLSSFGREKMEWSTCCFGTNPRRFSVPNCQLPSQERECQHMKARQEQLTRIFQEHPVAQRYVLEK